MYSVHGYRDLESIVSWMAHTDYNSSGRKPWQLVGESVDDKSAYAAFRRVTQNVSNYGLWLGNLIGCIAEIGLNERVSREHTV